MVLVIFSLFSSFIIVHIIIVIIERKKNLRYNMLFVLLLLSACAHYILQCLAVRHYIVESSPIKEICVRHKNAENIVYN